MKRLTTNGALIATLAIFVPIGVARGQDTTSRADTASQQAADRANQDTTNVATPGDTTGDAQNPQGYRGMERPVNVFPPDSAQRDTSAGAVEDRVTGTYEDSAWKDTTEAAQNPAGYRGMERPTGTDTARAGADTGGVTKQKAEKTSDKAGKKKATKKEQKRAAAAAEDSVQQDSTTWGREANRDPEVQNPPGYRGMERPVNVFPPDSAQRDTSAGAVEDRVSGTTPSPADSAQQDEPSPE